MLNLKKSNDLKSIKELNRNKHLVYPVDAECVVSAFNIIINMTDLLDLINQKIVNNKIIDFYFKMCCYKSNYKITSLPSKLFDYYKQKTLKNVLLSSEETIFGFDKILVPIRHDNNWSLAIIHPNKKETLLLLTESHGRHTTRFLKFISKIINISYGTTNSAFTQVDWEFRSNSRQSKCNNASDIYLCKKAKEICFDNGSFTSSNILEEIKEEVKNFELQITYNETGGFEWSEYLIHCPCCFTPYIKKGKSLKKHIKTKHPFHHSDVGLLSELPFFNYNEPENTAVANTSLITNYLTTIQAKICNNFRIVHLNINSIFLKVMEVMELLGTGSLDALMLNETKLDEHIPASFCNHTSYKCYRYDRNRNGGGIMVYIKKKFDICFFEKMTFCEGLRFTLKFQNTKVNLVSIYKPPHQNGSEFLDNLEEYITTFNLNDDLFIIGDLNMNLLNKRCKLNDFLKSLELKNWIEKPTRITNETYFSESLIDVAISNTHKTISTQTICCPFSDHKFLLIDIPMKEKFGEDPIAYHRNLNQKKLSLIHDQINKANINPNAKEVDIIWGNIKQVLMEIINSVSPLRKVSIKFSQDSPWIDHQLKEIRNNRNKAYKAYKNNNCSESFIEYTKFKKQYNSLLRTKLIEYFQDKTSNHFESSRNFWKFYGYM